MAKAIEVYSGNDTYMRSVEVAKREDGQFFWRSFGGVGIGWSGWKRYTDTPVVKQFDDGIAVFEWGFNNLRGGAVEKCRYRLPA